MYKNCLVLAIFRRRRSWFDSLTNILVNLFLPIFDTLMTNADVSYARLWSSCTNHIVIHLCQLSVLCLMLYCTVFPVYLSVFYVCV